MGRIIRIGARVHLKAPRVTFGRRWQTLNESGSKSFWKATIGLQCIPIGAITRVGERVSVVAQRLLSQRIRSWGPFKPLNDSSQRIHVFRFRASAPAMCYSISGVIRLLTGVVCLPEST